MLTTVSYSANIVQSEVSEEEWDGTRQSQKQKSGFSWTMMFKILAFMIITIFYYVILFALSGYGSALEEMRYGASVVKWSQYRRMKLRESLFMTLHFAAPANNSLLNLQHLNAFDTLIELYTVDQGSSTFIQSFFVVEVDIIMSSDGDGDGDDVGYEWLLLFDSDRLLNCLLFCTGLTYGNSRMGAPGVLVQHNGDKGNSASRIPLIFDNLCEFVEMKDVSQCQDIGAGLLLNGLHVGMREFTRDCMEQITHFERNPRHDKASQEQRFKSDESNYLRNLESNFLQPSLLTDIALVIEHLQSTITAFHATHLTLSIVFVLVLVALVFALYDPLVRELDKQEKHSRSMLLCIPDKVLDKFDAVGTILSAAP